MMERKFAKFFHRLVHDLIPDNGDRDQLFDTLRQYQKHQELHLLLERLRELLDEPQKLELYEFIRPLILLRHQMEYSYLAPPVPGVRLRTIRLFRQPGHNLGFAVRGGYEFGVGIFVSVVEQGSQAERQGLKVGDEIVRVNGFTIAEAIHEDVLNLIKSREEIVLKVTHIGMLPVKEHVSQSVEWQYVEDMDSKAALAQVLEEQRAKKAKPLELKIFIDCTGYESIGCGILSGPRYYPGIFVEKVRPGSLAEEAGLEVGDQLVEVNESSFLNIGHNEAVVVLRGSKQLNVIVRKHAGLPLFERRNQTSSSRSSQISSSSQQSAAGSRNSGAMSRQRAPESNGWDEGQIIAQQLSRNSGILGHLSSGPSSLLTDVTAEPMRFSHQAEVHSDSDSSKGAGSSGTPRIPVEEPSVSTPVLDSFAPAPDAHTDPASPADTPPASPTFVHSTDTKPASLTDTPPASPTLHPVKGTDTEPEPTTNSTVTESETPPGLNVSETGLDNSTPQTTSLTPVLDIKPFAALPDDLPKDRPAEDKVFRTGHPVLDPGTSASQPLPDDLAKDEAAETVGSRTGQPVLDPVSSADIRLPDDLGDPVLASLDRPAYPSELPSWAMPRKHVPLTQSHVVQNAAYTVDDDDGLYARVCKPKPAEAVSSSDKKSPLKIASASSTNPVQSESVQPASSTSTADSNRGPPVFVPPPPPPLPPSSEHDSDHSLPPPPPTLTAVTQTMETGTELGEEGITSDDPRLIMAGVLRAIKARSSEADAHSGILDSEAKSHGPMSETSVRDSLPPVDEVSTEHRSDSSKGVKKRSLFLEIQLNDKVTDRILIPDSSNSDSKQEEGQSLSLPPDASTAEHDVMGSDGVVYAEVLASDEALPPPPRHFFHDEDENDSLYLTFDTTPSKGGINAEVPKTTADQSTSDPNTETPKHTTRATSDTADTPDLPSPPVSPPPPPPPPQAPSPPVSSLPLGGAAAVMAARREVMDDRLPQLLGPESGSPPLPNALSGVGLRHEDLTPWFSPLELDGRELSSFVYPKTQDLGIQLEGGMGTPLGGKIVVAAVFDGGAAVEHGLQTGDQLMMVNGRKLIDITVSQAEQILEEAKTGPRDMIHLVYAQSSFLNDEECLTYF